MEMLLNEKMIKGKVNSPHLYRKGLTDFPKVQVDTLTFIPLSEKVLSILSGNPNFTAEEIETDYDEPEADNWNGVNENEEKLENFPIDEYSDKMDVIEIQRDINEKYQKAKTFVEHTVIDETKDNNTSPTKSEYSEETKSEKEK